MARERRIPAPANAARILIISAEREEGLIGCQPDAPRR
jgi:hypothetical protein